MNAISVYKLKPLCGLISALTRPFLPKERLEDLDHLLAMEITSVSIVFGQRMHRASAVTSRAGLT